MPDKKELKQQYKQTIQPMGIYKIMNTLNGKQFIASSRNLQGQMNRDRFQLKTGLHINRELQKEFTESGEEKFVFEIVDYLEPKIDTDYDYTKDLSVLLDLWIDKIQPFEPTGYHKKPVQR
jgi:hypothetical protein